MIIATDKIFSKKIKVIAIIFDTFIFLIGILILVFMAIGQLSKNAMMYSISTILWTIGILSITDILSYIFSKNGFSYKIIYKIRRKLHKTKKPTNVQNSFIDILFANESNSLENKIFFINGIKGTGKSECANLLLENLYSKISSHHEFLKYKLYFIDFFNDTINATRYFKETRNSDLNKSIIILDNSNEADVSIVSKIEHLIQAHNCSIILIEENNNLFQKLISFNNESLNSIEFNEPINEKKSKLCELSKKKKLTNLQKKILFTCDYYYRFYNIFCWSEVIKALGLSGFQSIKANKFKRKLLRKKIIEHFPLNTKYIKFTNISESKYIYNLKLNDSNLFYNVLNSLYKKEKNVEVKWMCMIDLPYELIIKNSSEKRLKLFNEAISFGNYFKLLNALQKCALSIEKTNLFSYEFGVLYYNNGLFGNALNYFSKVNYINKVELSIRLIEIMHGSKSIKIQNKVDNLLKYLESQEGIVRIYGKYWRTHIKSERGDFDICLINSLRLRLSKNNHNLISKSILERCITDELRFLWALGYEKNDLFLEIEKNYDEKFSTEKNYEYYLSLYFKAGQIHYNEIPLKIWIKHDFHNLKRLLILAENYYNEAINSSFEKNKSKMAAKAKLYDLELMKENFEKNYEEDLVAFKNNAIKQGIDLFVAFSDCLLAKGKILRVMIYDDNYSPQENDINEILEMLDNSTKIYSDYNNTYGINRNDFIKLLFNALLKFNSNTGKQEFNKCMNELKKFGNNCPYPLEKQYIDKLMRYATLRYVNILDTLRYYPIILQ